jgi:ubiquinone/menaquinone biosynthesis C-methylase UbiE
MKKTHYNPETIKNIYARISPIYDIWSRLTETRALHKALEFADIKNGESVLEVACGTGLLLQQIVNLNPDGRNEGLDISEAMLARAEKRLSANGNYKLVFGDAAALPYADGIFDVLINNYMLDLLPPEDYPAILEEFRRVLKPAGRLIIASMTTGRRWYNAPWEIIARHAPFLLAGCRPIDAAGALGSAGFNIYAQEYVSQNTFPSLILAAKKLSATDPSGVI